MKPECEDAMEEALGRPLRRGEADKIDKAVNRNMRGLAQKDPEAWQALSPLERLQQGAKAAADEMVREVKEKQRVLQLQIQAHDRIENALNHALDQLPEDVKPGAQLKAFSNLLAFDSSNRGRGLVSTETWSNAIKHEALGNLMGAWKSIRGFMGLLEDKRAAENLTREMWGEDSGDPTAKGAVKAWFKVTDDLHDRANKAGTNIGELKDWHAPQSWSQSRIAQGGKDMSASLQHWIDKQLPRLDRSRYLNEDGTRMTDAQVTDKVLTPAFDTQVTDGRNKRAPGSTSQGAAGDMSGHRILFFKDADSYMAAQGDFGEKNVWRAMQDHVNRMSREIALRETLGPEHADTFKYFNDRIALDEIRQHGESNTVNRNESYNQGLYDYVSGNHKIVDQRVSDIGQAFRNWQVATKLGSVVFTALGDEAGMASTAFANRVPWTDMLQRQTSFANPAHAIERHAAANSGLGISTVMGGLNRFGTEDFDLSHGGGFPGAMRQFSAKLAGAVMKYSGAEPMWDLRRRALGSVLMSSLANLVPQHEHFADLNEGDHGILARKGVTETDWKVWRMAKPEDWGSQRSLLTPKSIRDIPDDQLKALGDPNTLRRNASAMLLGHVLEEQSMGVMESGARQRAWMAGVGQGGGTAGAVAGELAKSAMLFKGFSFAMMQKHWTRAGSMDGTANYAARLITIGSIAGAAALQLQALARGEDPPNVAEPKFWAKAVLKGGGAGFYGDFLSEATNSNDNDLIAGLIGPAATEAQTIYNLTGGAAIKAAQGERTDELAHVIRYARSNNPLSTWYTKAAFDHLIWNDMQEAANPGYLDRMQSRAQSSRNTSWYWDPHESLPHTVPDTGKLWQPEQGAQQIDSIKNVVDKVAGQ